MIQLTLPLGTRAALGRDDFIVAPGNREAIVFIDSFPRWPAPSAALFGPPGSGKSHLVQIWAAQAQATIFDADALDDAAALRETLPAIAVENLDSATALPESVLFALFERGTPLLLTGREPPSQWKVRMPDLVSRFRAMLAFGLWAPDDELLAALARKLFDDRQLKVPETVIAQMIRSAERSPDGMRDVVARADARALALHKPVTPALIREVLEQTP